MTALYDEIGRNYSNLRSPDPRIAQMIAQWLGDSVSVLNVGAGAGSYEPTGKSVTAIEPSLEMIRQRKPSNTMLVQGRAEHLPFDDGSFDASMVVLTIHHWMDKAKGVREMQRVTRDRMVFLTYDPSHREFWLLHYFPELITLDEAIMPRMTDFRQWLGKVEIITVPVAHDCTDGFLACYWRRPEAYLSENVRASMSSFWKIRNIAEGIARLRRDLESGEWKRRYGGLMAHNELDCGYRLVVASP